MGVLETYSSLEEKSLMFEHKVIENRTDLENLINDLNNYNNKENNLEHIFRGVSEAKYKLYNSFQRAWIINEIFKIKSFNITEFKIYHQYINKMIDNLRKFDNNLLENYYKLLGSEFVTDIGLLSFLQHYGSPTPLIDWTYNFKKALFFSIRNLQHNESNDIDNYFSIYYIDKSKNKTELINYAEIYKNSQEQLANIKKIFPHADSQEVDDNTNYVRYNSLKGHSLFYISDFENIDLNKIMINTNLNIISQEGLFLFNNNPILPLENIFKGIENVEDGDTFHLHKIVCYDIHKNLSSELKRYLKKEEVIKSRLFPQEENIANNVYQSIFTNITKI